MTWTLQHLEEHLLIGSTLVEGSTLTESEAREILEGRTVSGHPVSEIREIQNHRAAIGWLIRELEAAPYLAVDLVRGLHRRLLDGLAADAGERKSHANYTFRSDGARHTYLHPGHVPVAMSDWVAAFNDAPDTGDPAEQAAALYARFQQIHPFQDGNGRIGRLLVAYLLHWKHRRSFHFYTRHKIAHLHAVEASDEGELRPLCELFRSLTSEPGE